MSGNFEDTLETLTGGARDIEEMDMDYDNCSISVVGSLCHQKDVDL